jgi:hypothetical protein
MEHVTIHGKPVRLGPREKSTARKIRAIGHVFIAALIVILLMKYGIDEHRATERANAAHTSTP